MPLPAGTECNTQAEDYLRTALSQSTNLRSWLGAVDASAALMRIFVDSIPSPANEEVYLPPPGSTEYTGQFPFALIYESEDDGFRLFLDNTPRFYRKSGMLHVRLERLLTDNEYEDLQQTWRNMKNWLGGIAREVTEYDGPLLIQSFKVGPPQMVPHDDNEEGEPRVAVTCKVEWGFSRNG